MSTLILEIPVQFSAIASGDGYWGMEKGTRVDIHEVKAWVNEYDNLDGTKDYYAELGFEHDTPAYDFGLCYTDKGITNAVRTFVARHPVLSKVFTHVTGSEQGMQDTLMMSCDANVENNIDKDAMIKLGFEEK